MRLTYADAIFWIAVVCCAVAQVAILRSALTAHRSLAEAAAEPATTLPPLKRGVELLWAFAPAVGLVLVLLFTWRAIHPAASVIAPPATASEVPLS